MSDAATAPGDLLARANEALGRGDWGTARKLFLEALEQRETPEALEGLATAAFFLDEPALALDSRERAYAAYREAGRAVDAGSDPVLGPGGPLTEIWSGVA